MTSTLERALHDLGEVAKETEIAFFGGSFTAIERTYMLTLLEAAKPFLKYFYGIRISTRPDCIDRDVLALLKAYHVTAIELGAQSMDNSVLELNRRGHTAEDVVNASCLIRENGISLGLQMMTGLYGSTPGKDIATAEAFIALQPDTVRIYPTVIMKGTELAELFQNGSFAPYSLDESVGLCAGLILMFAKADINIIRLGLHYSESLVQNSLGNNYHPAFKELCESKIFFDSFLHQAKDLAQKHVIATIHPKSLSKFLGQHKSNLKKWEEMGYRVEWQLDHTYEKYELGVWNATEIS